MKSIAFVLCLLFGSTCYGELPCNRCFPHVPHSPNPPTTCRLYTIRNDVYTLYTYYDGWGHITHQHKVYCYSYYTKEIRCIPHRYHILEE